MQISDEIIKVLEYLCGKIGLTIDWTSSNVLPYVQQLCEKYVKWEIGTSVTWIGISVSVVIITWVFSMVVDWCDMEKVIFWCVVCVAIIIIGVQVFDIVECYTFPEKAIYEYIQNYLSTHRN